MQSVKLKAHIGPDGLLKLELPTELANTDLEVLVVMQPLEASKAINGNKALTPEELGWPPGFFEQTAGSLSDDPIVIEPEGDFEVREELV